MTPSDKREFKELLFQAYQNGKQETSGLYGHINKRFDDLEQHVEKNIEEIKNSVGEIRGEFKEHVRTEGERFTKLEQRNEQEDKERTVTYRVWLQRLIIVTAVLLLLLVQTGYLSGETLIKLFN